MTVEAPLTDPVEARLLACYQQALGHELPNQLVAIQGLARMVQLEAGEQLGADAAGMLTRLAQLTHEVHAFVNSVSEIGRCCRQTGPPVSISLSEIWDEIAAEVKKQFAGRDVLCRTDGSLPTVVLPFASVHRVLAEVVRAAIRRAPNAIPLTITCKREESAGVRLSICDDGPAMTTLQQQQLFDPFVSAPGQKGAAVGLFLARQLAEGWGGRLDINPAADGGCVTTIEFPLS